MLDRLKLWWIRLWIRTSIADMNKHRREYERLAKDDPYRNDE